MISEPSAKGQASIREPLSSKVLHDLNPSGPLFGLKKVLPFGVREYATKEGRYAFEIPKGNQSLVLKESNYGELEIRFSNDLRSLAVHIAKSLGEGAEAPGKPGLSGSLAQG